MVVRHVQKLVEQSISPDIGSVFAAGRTQPAVARMWNELNMVAVPTFIDVTSQDSSSAGKNLSHIVEHRRSDEPSVGPNEIPPMDGKNVDQAETNTRLSPEHTLQPS